MNDRELILRAKSLIRTHYCRELYSHTLDAALGTATVTQMFQDLVEEKNARSGEVDMPFAKVDDVAMLQMSGTLSKRCVDFVFGFHVDPSVLHGPF